MTTTDYIRNDPTIIYLTGYGDGVRFILDIIARSAKHHSSAAAKQTLSSLYEVLNEGTRQWLTALETENSISPTSSTLL